MADELPPPPVPTDADLKDFPFTPIYRARLFGSAFHATASDSEWRAGVTLWLKSQDQRPAGSLPDNDIELCRLAELGRDLKTWKRLRAGALHGWYLCSDGRLYHNTVAGTVRDQWGGKTEQRQRTLKGRIAALEKRLSQATEEQAKADMAAQIQRLRQELSQSLSTASTERVTGSVTEPVTEAKREREGKGKGKGEGDSTSSVPNGTAAKAASDVATVVFTQGLDWLQRAAGKPEGQCRSLLGKWRRDHGDEALISVLGAAQRAAPIDAVEWIEGAFRKRAKPRVPRADEPGGSFNL